MTSSRTVGIVMTMAIVVGGVSPVMGGEFYLDCGSGDDRSDGRSPDSPWATLQRVNETELFPGDSILLRRGTTCEGMLAPLGSGSPERPITLASYGVGPRPVIDAGDNEAAVRLFNQEYWHLRELETRGGNPFGVLVSGDVDGVLDHFRIVDIRVHDVRGTVNNKESGLVVVTPGAAETTFNDVVIDGVTAYSSTQWAGILVGGDDFGGTPGSPRSSNVTIRNSTVHDVYGDGIVLYQVDGGLIEHNVAYDTGKAPDRTVGTPNGIWTWMCGDCTVQFNEGYLTTSPGVDGGVYDIDYGCSDNVVQYNYAHDADAYCIAVFGAFGYATSNSIVRYNVCANNGRDPSKAYQGDIYVFTWNGGTIDGLQIHNNTVYWNPAADAPAIRATGATFSADRPLLIKNNIVLSTTPRLVALDPDSGLDLDHNLYWYSGSGDPIWTEGAVEVSTLAGWRGRGHDSRSSYADPLLIDPGRRFGSGVTRAFALRTDSPAIDGGAAFGAMGSRDFDGRVIPFGMTFDIGALEWHPETRCGNGLDDDGDDYTDCDDPDCAGTPLCCATRRDRSGACPSPVTRDRRAFEPS